jgi:hypothetical protein
MGARAMESSTGAGPLPAPVAGKMSLKFDYTTMHDTEPCSFIQHFAIIGCSRLDGHARVPRGLLDIHVDEETKGTIYVIIYRTV